jgi:hypothetical protein
MRRSVNNALVLALAHVLEAADAWNVRPSRSSGDDIEDVVPADPRPSEFRAWLSNPGGGNVAKT